MEVSGAAIYGFASIILMIGYFVSIRASDLIRVLIALELMFNAIFLALTPLFMINATVALGVLVVSILASSTEFMTLIIAIMSLDRVRKTISVEEIKAGGEVQEEKAVYRG